MTNEHTSAPDTEGLDVVEPTIRHFTPLSYCNGGSVLVEPPAIESFEALGPTSAPLRHALRALASKPDFFRAPHEAIARLRPRVDKERRRLGQDLTIGGSRVERRRSWTRLADGAVIGLSFLARVCVDVEARSMVAPFALIAVGKYGARCCDPDTVLELQYLLPEDQESWERGGRIVAFMRIGLAELGLEHHDAMGTAVECARVARGDAIAAARFATARFLSGQYGLHAGFVGVLGRASIRGGFDADPLQSKPIR